MKGKRADMYAIFDELSDTNKDIVLLIAKSVKVAQEATARELRDSHGSCIDREAEADILQ